MNNIALKKKINILFKLLKMGKKIASTLNNKCQRTPTCSINNTYDKRGQMLTS